MVIKSRPPLEPQSTQPLPGGQPSRRERKKLATRARIIEAAIRIFGERGMTAPTVEEIAAAADVGKGTIYNYFATKEEIVLAFMVEVERRVQAQVADFASRRGPLHSILADFIRYQLRLKEPYRDFVRLFMAQLYLRGAELAPHFQEMQKAINPPLRELFTGLIGRRLLPRDVHLRSLIEIFELLHVGILTRWINDSPPYRATFQLLDEEMRLFCKGLSPSGATSGASGDIPERNPRT